jgi:hypothetical protein
MGMTIGSNVSQTLATIKGIESQLSSLALNAHDRDAQRKFHEAMIVIGEIKNDLIERINTLEFEEPQYKK